MLIDLTHAISSDIPHWDEECCFRMHTLVDYKDCAAPNLFRVQKMEMKAGTGTHIDAPAHCFPSTKTVDQLSLDTFVTECIVISGEPEADWLLTPEHIQQFEKQHGTIPAGTFVIINSGWAKYWNDRKKYRNNLHFPSISDDAAKVLKDKAICGLGIDTLSPDAGGKDFPAHRTLLGAGIFIIENVANADKLPPSGARIMIMPMNVEGATEAPIRLVAELS